MARRVTAADVAEAAGVSRATVSFVLNRTPGQSISPAVRLRVERQAHRLGYRPDLHARALVSGSSRIVLVLLPEWPVEHVLRSILDEASSTLDERGYTLVTSDPRHTGKARPLWESLQPDVVLPIDPLPHDEVARIQAAGCRVVPLSVDEAEVASGADEQIRYLAARGHLRLAYASTDVPGFAHIDAARLAAARRVAAAGGLHLVDARVSGDSAREMLHRWLDAGITAVAAFNDDTAASVIGAAVRAGVHVPERLAIMGHDDAPIARLVVPALTTVRFDASGLGNHLAELALSMLQDDAPMHTDRPIVLPTVVERESA